MARQRTDATDPARHYHVVDLLRGLASIAVLFVHYRHFLMDAPGAAVAPSRLASQPFFAQLELLYTHGDLAVNLFWMISGFVFAAAYMDKCTTTGAFVLHRVARLYPLHLLTLVIVALLQAISVTAFGAPQIYANNAPADFAAQLFMASNWHGYPRSSFNFPIWSVSMEIVIYALFWFTLPFVRAHRLAGFTGFVLASFWLDRQVSGSGQLLASCALFFFAGALLHEVVRRIERSRGVLGLACALLVAGAAAGHGGIAHSISLVFTMAGVLAACVAADRGPAGRVAHRCRWIGDNTYGVYLWHVPIQIAALLVLAAWGVPRTIVLEPWFFMAFMAAVMLTARLSFVGFEEPARKAIRNWGLTARHLDQTVRPA